MKKFAGLIASLALANEPAWAAQDIVAANNIRAGSIVTAADIVTPDDRESMRRAFSIIGREAVRTFYRGQKLVESDLRKPTIVKRNTIVEMKFENGPMTILAEGRALENGGMGDRIEVMNILSKRVISMTVYGADSVRTKQ